LTRGSGDGFSWANDPRPRGGDFRFTVPWFGPTWAPSSSDDTIDRVATAQILPQANVRGSSLTFVALAVNLAVTLPLAAILNIWQDEAYTLQTTSRDLGYAFHQAIGFEQNAPLYFLLLTVWRHFGDSIFFLRLPSVLCVAITVALVPALVRRYLPGVDAGLVTLVVALNPFAIWAALEMRVYALIILLSALALLTFFAAFLEERPNKFWYVGYAICVAVALYTQYYLGFLVAAQALTLLIYKRKAFVAFTLCGAAAALAFVPMLAIVPGQVQNFKSAFAPPSLLHAVIALAGILARYALPLSFPHAKIAYLVLTIGAAVAAFAARRAFTASGNGMIIVMTACGVALFAAGTYASGVHVLDRHAASLFLPCTLSAFAAFTFFRTPLQRRLILAWFCLVVAASSVSLVQTYAARAKPGDWIRVTSYIRHREMRNEPIVVFEAENALPFAHYYDGPNRVVAIPHGVDFRHYDVTRFVVGSDADLRDVMPQTQHVWLITAGGCTSANISFGCDALERFVAERYRVEQEATFHGSRVRLLRRNGT
jgi:hypothetical protein